MYKVLLVDDERIILEGISSLIKWGEVSTVLIGTARNGVEAYDLIVQELPDIVISDIRMPGLNGLELVKKVNKEFPKIHFILLSGYAEFDYARQAMQYGVKHYLLKPCNEQLIIESLKEVVADLDMAEKRERFVESIKKGLHQVLPYAQEQFLKEFISNKIYGERDWEHYQKIFNIPLEQIQLRMILFQLEGEIDFEHLYAVKNIAEEILGASLIKLSSNIGDKVIMLVEECDSNLLFEYIEEIKHTFYQFYKVDFTVAISNPGTIKNARRMYTDTLECLKHRFYLGEGSVITINDIQMSECTTIQPFVYDEEKLLFALRSGNWDEASGELNSFFASLINVKLDETTTKSYIIQLFVTMIRQCQPTQMDEYFKKLIHFEELHTIHQLKECMETLAYQIAASNYSLTKKKHSSIITKILESIEQNLENPELSLNWISNKCIYMNPDYLGKLFKKEIGEKFSNYVVKIRIEKAMKLIKQKEDVRVFEVAESTGFGNNPQYFSQVFKKYTGFSPSDYKNVN